MINKEVLICPKCKSDLSNDEYFQCTNTSCNLKYLVIEGLPVMIPGDAEKIKKEILDTKEKDPMFDKKILGVPVFKVDYFIKKNLYNLLGIKMPKLADQRDYWLSRGNDYYSDFVNNGYANLEIFFQDLVVNELKQLEFNSIFEAGCGFGWNIRRFKEEFSHARVGGLDFSHGQLLNGKTHHLKDTEVELAEGDITQMPFKDNTYDVGFSLGVFMNISPNKIEKAVDEMIRVCGKYIIHLEYDENYATEDLRERRAFKTNIVSHDYKKLYEDKGLKVLKFLTAEDFGKDYETFMQNKTDSVNRWEAWEGASKYILIIAEKTG